MFTNSGAFIFNKGKKATIVRLFNRPHNRLGAPPANDATAIIAILDLVAVELLMAASFSFCEVISMEFRYILIAGFSTN